MYIPRWVVFTALLILLIGGTFGVAGADGGYDLSMDTGVEVPERTVENPENESEEFTITTVGRSTPGESAVVDVSPLADTRYSVYFREEDGDPIDFVNRIQGDQQVEFNAGSEPAGSYVITAGESSAPDAVLPVVIEGYVLDSLKLDGEDLAGSTITTDSSHNITIELTEQSDLSVSSVTLTLWREGEGVVHEASLEETAGSATTFEGSLSNLTTGEYNAQVRIRGGETVNGEAELIGLSDNQPLTVEATTSDGGNGTDGSSSTSGGSGSDGGSGALTGGSDDGTSTNETTTSAGNESDTGDEADDDATNTTDDSSGETDPNTTDTSSDNNATGEPTDAQSPNDTDDSTDSDEVIEPNTNSSDSNTNDSTPLYAVPLVLALVVATAAVRRILRVLRMN